MLGSRGSGLVEVPPHMGGTMRPAMAERHKQELSETEAKDLSCDVMSGFISTCLELCPFFPILRVKTRLWFQKKV